jgi:transketolase
MRKALVEVVEEVIRSNENSALLLGDIGVYGFRNALNDFPNRVFNLGILEQSMTGVAAGLASEGVVPIVHTIAPFLVERSLEQLKIDFGYQRLAGNFVSVGASFDYSGLGCTHHCPADVNILSSIEGFNIFLPGSPSEFKYLFNKHWNNGEINYFRLSEESHTQSIVCNFGEIQKVHSGGKATIIAVGPILDDVLEAANGLDVELLYCSSISQKAKMQLEVVSNKLIIVEPFNSGSIRQKLTILPSSSNPEILEVGVPVKFIRNYGTVEELKELLKLDVNSLRDRFVEFLS